MKTIKELRNAYVALIVKAHAEFRWYDAGELEEMLNEAYAEGAIAAQGWSKIKLDKNGVITQDCRAEIKANLPVLLMLSKDDFFAPKCYKAMNIDDWLTWSGKVNMGYTQTHWRPIEYK